jgi:hypothetical protein
MAEKEQKLEPKADPAGGAEGGMAEGSAGGPGQGNTLKDASDEAMREIEKRGEAHAGTGDYG